MARHGRQVSVASRRELNSGSRINPPPAPMLLSVSAQCRYLCLLRILLQLELGAAHLSGNRDKESRAQQLVCDSIVPVQLYIYLAVSLADDGEISFCFPLLFCIPSISSLGVSDGDGPLLRALDYPS